jgi:hypothetical protein
MYNILGTIFILTILYIYVVLLLNVNRKAEGKDSNE